VSVKVYSLIEYDDWKSEVVEREERNKGSEVPSLTHFRVLEL